MGTAPPSFPSPMPDPKSTDPKAPNLKSEAQRLADAAKHRADDAVEEIKVASNQLVDKVRELIEDANVKRVTIVRGDKVLLEIPLTVGVGAGAAALLLNPVLSAVGALAALVADITLVVERDEAAAEQAAKEAASDDTVSNANEPDASGDKTVGKPPAA